MRGGGRKGVEGGVWIWTLTSKKEEIDVPKKAFNPMIVQEMWNARHGWVDDLSESPLSPVFFFFISFLFL